MTPTNKKQNNPNLPTEGEVGTHPPYVLHSEDSDKIIFNFMQSVVQQAQQHMFQQLEQCMQQAYTGPTLGTPVRAKEYSEQFKKITIHWC